jgi:ADP-heptose:LPS heptosyltransferase
LLLNGPKTILVYVGADLIGDGLMKLPFVRALRAAFPGAHISWVAGKGRSTYAHELAPLVAGLLDEVIEEAGFDGVFRNIVHRPLGGRHFDLVIDTQRGVPASLLLRRIRHDCFITGAADFWLSDRRPPRGYERPAAMVRQMLDLVELASGKPVSFGTPLELDGLVVEAAGRALPPGPVYVGFAPGAGGKHKCWPMENFITLARIQAGRGRVPVFILGPEEAGWAADIKTELPDARFAAPEDAVTPGVSPSPAFTIAAARRLAAAVANDSGAGHMIAAADVPLISLFGPTPPAKFAPQASALTVIAAQDFGGPGMTGDMASISLKAVRDALEKALEKAP